MHRKKKVREFPVPSRDVITKLSLGGNNDVITELFLPSGSLVSDIPAGDGKLVNLFLRCMVYKSNAIQTWNCFLLRILNYAFFYPNQSCLLNRLVHPIQCYPIIELFPAFFISHLKLYPE
jgi:hypothetical protein